MCVCVCVCVCIWGRGGAIPCTLMSASCDAGWPYRARLLFVHNKKSFIASGPSVFANCPPGRLACRSLGKHPEAGPAAPHARHPLPLQPAEKYHKRRW